MGFDMPIRRKPIQATLLGASSERVVMKQAAADENPNDAVVREFTWNLAAINIHMEDIRRIWADLLGVSGPQWLILMAISELDAGKGVSVGEVSTKLQVHQSFVTTQTKNLERSGFLIRTTSSADARIVLMSLTEKARKEIGKLTARRNKLNDFIFADMSDRSLRDITDSLTLIKYRVEKAALQLDLDNS